MPTKTKDKKKNTISQTGPVTTVSDAETGSVLKGRLGDRFLENRETLASQGRFDFTGDPTIDKALEQRYKEIVDTKAAERQATRTSKIDEIRTQAQPDLPSEQIAKKEGTKPSTMQSILQGLELVDRAGGLIRKEDYDKLQENLTVLDYAPDLALGLPTSVGKAVVGTTAARGGTGIASAAEAAALRSAGIDTAAVTQKVLTNKANRFIQGKSGLTGKEVDKMITKLNKMGVPEGLHSKILKDLETRKIASEGDKILKLRKGLGKAIGVGGAFIGIGIISDVFDTAGLATWLGIDNVQQGTGMYARDAANSVIFNDADPNIAIQQIQAMEEMRQIGEDTAEAAAAINPYMWRYKEAITTASGVSAAQVELSQQRIIQYLEEQKAKQDSEKDLISNAVERRF